MGKLDVTRRNYQAAVVALKHYTDLEKGNSTAYFLLAMAYRGLGERRQMNQAIDSYKKPSQDAKERSLAQKELRPAEVRPESMSEKASASQSMR